MPSRSPGTATDRPTRHVSQQRTDRPENEQRPHVPTPAGCCRLVGLSADHEKADQVQQLVGKYGRKQVTQWVQDGIPVEAMGKPQEMATAEPAGNRSPTETGTATRSAATGDSPSGADSTVQSHSHAKPNRQPLKQSKFRTQIRQLMRDSNQKLQTHTSGRSRQPSRKLTALRTNTPEAYEDRKKRLEGIDPVTNERSRSGAPTQRGPTCFSFASIDAPLRAAGLEPTIMQKMSEEKYLLSPRETTNVFYRYPSLKQYAKHGQSGGRQYLRDLLQSSQMPLLPGLRPDIVTVGVGLERLFDTKQAEAMQGDSRSGPGAMAQSEIEQRLRQREPHTGNHRERARELVDAHATIKRNQQQIANQNAIVTSINNQINKYIQTEYNAVRTMSRAEIDINNISKLQRRQIDMNSDWVGRKWELEDEISVSQRHIGTDMDEVDLTKRAVTNSFTRQDADVRAGTAWLKRLLTDDFPRMFSKQKFAMPSTASDLEKWFTRTVSAFGGTAVMSATAGIDGPHFTYIVGLIERNGETHVGVRDSTHKRGEVDEVPFREFITKHNPFTKKGKWSLPWLSLQPVDLDDQTIAELTQSQQAHPNRHSTR